MRSTVGLIGGSGFIGQVLTPCLQANNHEIRILDIADPPVQRPGVEFRRADVTDVSQMVQHLKGCGLVINLAAAHRDDVRPVSLYHDVNVKGAENVCLAAEQLGIRRIIFTSSVAIYGFQPGIPDEDTAAKPFNPYGQTKWEAEGVYRTWQQRAADRNGLIMVRPTVVFGPGNRGNVYNLFAQLARGHFIMVGDGQNRKSMAYVQNVASFLAHMADYKPDASGTLVYNYCDKDDFRMNELLSVVRQALGRTKASNMRLPYSLGLAIGSMFDAAAGISGRNFPISRIRVEKFCANTIFAADRLRETGFVPPYDLKRAVQDTIVTEFGAAA